MLDEPLGTESGGTGNADGTIPLANILADDDSATAFVNSIRAAILNAVYPVGSIFITTNSTSPAALLGGTWEQVKDRFLLAAGDTHHAGEENGAESYNLNVDHRHQAPIGYSDSGSNPVGGININGTFSGGNGRAYRTVSRDFSGTLSSNVTMYYTGTSAVTDTIPTMPPYMAVYVWKRIA